jgi:hypothetical protein
VQQCRHVRASAESGKILITSSGGGSTLVETISDLETDEYHHRQSSERRLCCLTG